MQAYLSGLRQAKADQPVQDPVAGKEGEGNKDEEKGEEKGEEKKRRWR